MGLTSGPPLTRETASSAASAGRLPSRPGATFRIKSVEPQNTTIAIVATDAALTKTEAKRLAIMAHDGMARALRPTHAAMDGDTIFAAATGASAKEPTLADKAEIGSLRRRLPRAGHCARGVRGAGAALCGRAAELAGQVQVRQKRLIMATTFARSFGLALFLAASFALPTQ